MRLAKRTVCCRDRSSAGDRWRPLARRRLLHTQSSSRCVAPSPRFLHADPTCRRGSCSAGGCALRRAALLVRRALRASGSDFSPLYHRAAAAPFSPGLGPGGDGDWKPGGECVRPSPGPHVSCATCSPVTRRRASRRAICGQRCGRTVRPGTAGASVASTGLPDPRARHTGRIYGGGGDRGRGCVPTRAASFARAGPVALRPPSFTVRPSP